MGERGPDYYFCDFRVVYLLISNRRSGNNNRGRLDIIADILDASCGGVRKTYLMYHCNLSFSQLKDYSLFLVSKGLMDTVRSDGDSHPALFEVTSKGREFLRVYRGLKALMT